MRLNFSHATVEEVELRLKNLAASQVRKFGSVLCCDMMLCCVFPIFAVDTIRSSKLHTTLHVQVLLKENMIHHYFY